MSTPPPTSTAPAAQSPEVTSPAHKRIKVSSEVDRDGPATAENENAPSAQPQPAADLRNEQPSTTPVAAQPAHHETPDEPPREDEDLVADDDSTYGSEGSVASGSTSIRSSIFAGYMEHGRRYQTVREGPGQYFVPSDEKQFESMEAGHFLWQLLECNRENPYFLSPISANAQNALDVGCGTGQWAIDVSDKFPNLTVRGMDLYPPPNNLVPPNCILEVDDCLKPWMFTEKFDLIHLRILMGSFQRTDFQNLYKQAYANLAPGGWIESFEGSIQFLCDDGTMPANSHVAKYHEVLEGAAAKAGNYMDIMKEMRGFIEDAGFVNVQEKNYKVPVGPWAKSTVHKDIGSIHLAHLKAGIEGWCMFLLTKFGEPTPWSPEEVQVWLAKIRQDLNSGWHMYEYHKRVWAQKPYGSAPAEPQQPNVETLVE